MPRSNASISEAGFAPAEPLRSPHRRLFSLRDRRRKHHRGAGFRRPGARPLQRLSASWHTNVYRSAGASGSYSMPVSRLDVRARRPAARRAAHGRRGFFAAGLSASSRSDRALGRPPVSPFGKQSARHSTSQLGDLPEKFAAVAHAGSAFTQTHRLRSEGELETHRSELQRVPALPAGAPVLNRLTDYAGANNVTPEPTYIGGSMGFRGGAETMSVDGKRRRDCLPGLSEEDRRRVSLLRHLSQSAAQPASRLHDGSHAVAASRGPNQDRLRVAFSSRRKWLKPDFVADDAIEFWDTTNREDWKISELSQAGIQSRAYTPGPYSRREELLHAFDEVVLRGRVD